ncbi:MAG: hypothetical protein L0Z53_25785, partial [Acidobacteriales bacterium]|nr:hypothetical protein [Terriglobales bacterium]
MKMIVDAPDVQEQPELKEPQSSIARLPREMEVERVSLFDHVKTIEVSSQQTYEEMAALQVSAATLTKKAEVFFEDHLGLAKLRGSYQTLLRAKKEVVDSLEEARKLASKKNGNFLAEQERIRQQAQRKADEEARQLAEEQRRKELEAAKKEGATKKE